VNEEALRGIQSDMGVDELAALKAFDLNRDRIYAVAARCMGAVTKARTTCCLRTSNDRHKRRQHPSARGSAMFSARLGPRQCVVGHELAAAVLCA